MKHLLDTCTGKNIYIRANTLFLTSPRAHILVQEQDKTAALLPPAAQECLHARKTSVESYYMHLSSCLLNLCNILTSTMFCAKEFHNLNIHRVIKYLHLI